MPHSDRAALDGFIAELRRVWTMAGPPSYQDFEKLSISVKGPAEGGDLWLPRSTTQEILSGRRRHPPKWRWVIRFITVLRVAAAEAGVDPDRIGTLAEWKQKHEAASALESFGQNLIMEDSHDVAVAYGVNVDFQKLWDYCNVLRDEGLSYPDCLEQLTFLLFLKMADEQAKPPLTGRRLFRMGWTGNLWYGWMETA